MDPVRGLGDAAPSSIIIPCKQCHGSLLRATASARRGANLKEQYTETIQIQIWAETKKIYQRKRAHGYYTQTHTRVCMAMLGENRKQHYLAMLQHILLLIAPDTHSQVNYNRVSAKRPRLIDTNSINTICRKKEINVWPAICRSSRQWNTTDHHADRHARQGLQLPFPPRGINAHMPRDRTPIISKDKN
jgi:hypothetical protein